MTSIAIRVWRRISHRLVHGARRHALYPYLYPASWRGQSGAPAAADHANYMTALPNPGAGIGHQMANWVAGYHFARLFGCRYAHADFPEGDWETLLNFGEGEHRIAEVRAEGYRLVRLPLFDEDDEGEMAHIRRIVDAHRGRRVLFRLERDQFQRDQHLAMDDLARKYAASAGRRAVPLVYELGRLNIAVHVRRGDVSLDMADNPNIAMRWIEIDYFERVLERVLASPGGSNSPRIHIFSQGKPEDFASFERYPDVRLCLDMDARQSFVHLAAADILIASKSGFSYGAALLGHGVRIVPEPFWHGYPDDPLWVEATNDAFLDDEQLARAFAAFASARHSGGHAGEEQAQEA